MPEVLDAGGAVVEAAAIGGVAVVAMAAGRVLEDEGTAACSPPPQPAMRTAASTGPIANGNRLLTPALSQRVRRPGYLLDSQRANVLRAVRHAYAGSGSAAKSPRSSIEASRRHCQRRANTRLIAWVPAGARSRRWPPRSARSGRPGADPVAPVIAGTSPTGADRQHQPHAAVSPWFRPSCRRRTPDCASRMSRPPGRRHRPLRRWWCGAPRRSVPHR